MVSVVDAAPSQGYLDVGVTLSEQHTFIRSLETSYWFCGMTKRIPPHSAVVVFGLQVDGTNHIYPDQTLLRTTIWQLSELPRRSCNTRVVWQRIHLEGALQVHASR